MYYVVLSFQAIFVAIWGILLITCPGRDHGFLYWLADASRCKRLLGSVEVIFMGEAVTPFFSCFCVFLCCLSSPTSCFYLLLLYYVLVSFFIFLKFKYAALDSDDLLYLKEQMEAEEDAERLLRRTEKRAFAAFKISFLCSIQQITIICSFWFSCPKPTSVMAYSLLQV